MNSELEALRPALERGLHDLAVPADDTLLDNLLAYLGELSKWNKAYNLTAIRDPAEMLTRHLLDSFTVLSYISGQQIIDLDDFQIFGDVWNNGTPK